MAARPAFVPAAMVDDKDQAVEGIAYFLGGLDVGCHIDVLAFAARQALVERIQDDDARDQVTDLLPHLADQNGMILDKVGRRRRDDFQRRRSLRLAVNSVQDAERGDALLVSIPALKGAIDDPALLHSAVVVGHSARDVETYVKHEEALEAFRLAPHHAEPLLGEKL